MTKKGVIVSPLPLTLGHDASWMPGQEHAASSKRMRKAVKSSSGKANGAGSNAQCNEHPSQAAGLARDAGQVSGKAKMGGSEWRVLSVLNVNQGLRLAR